MKQRKNISGWTTTTTEWDIFKMKCQNITWNQWNNRSNVLLDWLKKQDAGQWWKAEAAAEKVGDDVILQQINTEEAAEIEYEHTIVLGFWNHSFLLGKYCNTVHTRCAIVTWLESISTGLVWLDMNWTWLYRIVWLYYICTLKMYIRSGFRIYGKYTIFTIKLYIRSIVYTNTAADASMMSSPEAAISVRILILVAWIYWIFAFLTHF